MGDKIKEISVFVDESGTFDSDAACVDKRTVDDYGGLRAKLLREISAFLASKLEELNAYDKLKIYCDNGRSDVLSLLREGFKPFGSRAEKAARELGRRENAA